MPTRRRPAAGPAGAARVGAGDSTGPARIGYATPSDAPPGDTAPVEYAKDRMESRIERLCVERNLKMTGQRRVIARVLSEAEDHPDVEELYRRASALDNRISIATVYRTVRLLEENGILARRDFGGGRARYEPTAHGRHYHLIDVDTGRVIEFEDAELERLMGEIAARIGFELISHRLELFGRKRPAKREAARTESRPAVQAGAPALDRVGR